MRSKTLTFYATHHTSRNGGRPRTIAVSLPFVACLADDPHYKQPPKPPPAERGPRITDRAIRRVLGRDPEPPMSPRAAAIMRRVERRGY